MAGEGAHAAATKSKGGKKAATGSQKTAGEGQKAASTRGLWRSSVISKEDIAALQASGYLPEAEVARDRSPLVKGPAGSTSVRVPQPRSGERIIFISHLLRGLGFPIHLFLRGLLYFYGL